MGDMRLLGREQIRDSLQSLDPNSIFVDPLLDDAQIGNVSLDIRLGYDFLVSIQTRSSSIDVGRKQKKGQRSIGSYFQETRRELGERFIVHPGQVVLACSLEYVSVPSDVITDVSARSSYVRLGLPMNGTIQPGFRGCIPIELFNHGNTPVELVVGARVCQMRFWKLDYEQDYLLGAEARKYFGNVRPQVSAADNDLEIEKLIRLASG